MSRQILLCSIAIALLASAACSKRTTESARAEFASLRAKAEAGNAAAQFDLGIMYRAGAGVPKDLVQAHMWWNIAGAKGNEGAKKNLAEVEKQMSSEQKAEATMLAREMFARLEKK